MNAIRQWLESLGLEKYQRSFAENDIDVDILTDLGDDDFKLPGQPWYTRFGQKFLCSANLSPGTLKMRKQPDYFSRCRR